MRSNDSKKSYSISPQELRELQDREESLEIIDVRTAVEFREHHLDTAKNRPLDKLDPNEIMDQRNGRKTEPLYVICRSGSRAEKACEKFVECGYENVVNVEGGTQACESSGLPMVYGRKAVSLERQVRIAAGLLVLLGTILGWQIHTGYLLLSGFVGAGLTFAGITDTCGMGMLLAKMPWNKVRNTNV